MSDQDCQFKRRKMLGEKREEVMEEEKVWN